MKIYVSEMFDDGIMNKIVRSTGAGIETIDFARSDYLDDEKHADIFRRRLPIIGTDDVIVHGPFFDLNAVSYDVKIAAVSSERMEQAYRAAALIGSRKMVFHSGYIPYMVFREGWAERMKNFWSGFLAGKPDLQIRIENVVDPDPSMLRDFIQMTENPRIRLCLDIGHANCASKISAYDWAVTLKGMIGEMHLHDNHGERDEHLGLGKGTVAWQKIIERVLSDSPDCDLTMECLDRQDAEESVRLVREVTGE